MSSIPEQGTSPEQFRGDVNVDDAARLLEQAAHDIAVASSCLGLGDLDEAHTNVITARIAADAAEEILRTVLGFGPIGAT
jgi:hypothetical protein